MSLVSLAFICTVYIRLRSTRKNILSFYGSISPLYEQTKNNNYVIINILVCFNNWRMIEWSQPGVCHRETIINIDESSRKKRKKKKKNICVSSMMKKVGCGRASTESKYWYKRSVDDDNEATSSVLAVNGRDVKAPGQTFITSHERWPNVPWGNI